MRVLPLRFRGVMDCGVLAIATVGGLVGCGSDNHAPVASQPPAATFNATKANCGANDRPETALQGQVPAALRANGFIGFSCNLVLLGQMKNDGANWQSAHFYDGARTCAYHGSSFATTNRTHLGVPVVDITSPAAPTTTTFLTTTAMLDPWESLKVNERRKVLAADNGNNGGAGPELDIYDISGDCRFPQLLSSVAMTAAPDGIPDNGSVSGHEGEWAPDGLTYYIGDTRNWKYHAVDTTDLTHPVVISTFDPLAFGWRTHGLSISSDGRRAYFTSPGNPSSLSDLVNATTNNGFMIVDTSDVQDKKPNPVMRLIAKVPIKEGTAAQHTIPVKIAGKPYVIHVDEGGSAGGGNDAATYLSRAQAACSAGMPPFAAPQFVDISDETNPKIVSRVALETHDPANCAKVLPDVVGLSVFTYGSHYCSVDNRDNATTLACGFFNSGIRIFDIRDPLHPKEIAYYNPAGTTTPSPGSNHIGPRVPNTWVAGGPDWCSAQVHLNAATGTVWSTCQDNGVIILKFTNGVWPFPESTTPPGKQN